MKTRVAPAILALVGILLFLGQALPAAAQESVAGTVDVASLPEVVATVNGIEIRKSELITQTTIVRAQIRRAGGKDPANSRDLFRRVLDGLIGEALMYDDAKKRGLVASDAEVDKGVEGFKANYEDQAAFDAGLKAQGTSVEQLRAQLRQSLSIEKVLRQELQQDVKVSEADARAFYQQNQAAFVGQPEYKIRLVRVPIEAPGDALARERARQKAESARRKILEGIDFAEVVRQFSNDPLTKDKGGELPPFPLGKGPVDLAISKLEINQISQVIEDHGAFQVIQLREKLPARTISFEEARPRIEGLIQQGKLQDTVLARVEALRRAAKIETKL